MSDNKLKNKSGFVTEAAVIGAAYAVLTLLLAPISYGVMQIRISESLCALSILTPAAVPGLAIGCFLANILGPNGIVDAALGTLATLIGCFGIRMLKKRHPMVAMIPNVLSNGVIVGLMLCKIYSVNLNPWYCIAWVSLGEALSCIIPGYFLIRYIDKTGILHR